MKKFKIVLGVMILFLLTGCGESKYLKEISYKEYEELIKNKESFVVEIMRDGCSACESFKPTLKEFTEEYKIEVKYINTDNLTDEEIDTFGISGTPTLIFYKDGVEQTVSSRLIGAVSKDKIVAKFKANEFMK